MSSCGEDMLYDACGYDLGLSGFARGGVSWVEGDVQSLRSGFLDRDVFLGGGVCWGINSCLGGGCGMALLAAETAGGGVE